MIINNLSHTRIEDYPKSEPVDTILKYVEVPTPSVKGYSICERQLHPTIDPEITANLFSVDSMLKHGMSQDVRTVSFDSETPESTLSHFNGMIDGVEYAPTEEDVTPTPTPTSTETTVENN